MQFHPKHKALKLRLSIIALVVVTFVAAMLFVSGVHALTQTASPLKESLAECNKRKTARAKQICRNRIIEANRQTNNSSSDAAKNAKQNSQSATNTGSCSNFANIMSKQQCKAQQAQQTPAPSGSGSSTSTTPSGTGSSSSPSGTSSNTDQQKQEKEARVGEGTTATAPEEPEPGNCPDGFTEVSVAPGDTNGDGSVNEEDKCIDEGSGDIASNPIITYLKGIINFLAVGVGLFTAISIVIRGFQFMSARDNPQTVQAAVQGIWNGVIALLLFIFMYAILNFLVPGGLIG